MAEINIKYINSRDKISNRFESPDEFFTKGIKTIKSDKIKILKENKKLLPYNFVGPNDLFQEIKKQKLSPHRSIDKFSNLGLYQNMNSLKVVSKRPTYKYSFNIIDTNELPQIYQKIKEKLNSNKTHSLDERNLPKNIKESLKSQTNKMNLLEENRKKLKNLSQFLTLKTGKDENDLLINSNNNNTIKTEINKIILSRNRNSNLDQSGEWTQSLRNPNEKYYINVGSDLSPKWITQKKLNHKDSITLNNKVYCLPKIDRLKSSYFVKEASKKYNIDINKMIDAEGLKIECKSLLEEEHKSSEKIKGYKYLHEPDYKESNEEFVQIGYDVFNDNSLISKNNRSKSTNFGGQISFLK